LITISSFMFQFLWLFELSWLSPCPSGPHAPASTSPRTPMRHFRNVTARGQMACNNRSYRHDTSTSCIPRALACGPAARPPMRRGRCSPPTAARRSLIFLPFKLQLHGKRCKATHCYAVVCHANLSPTNLRVKFWWLETFFL
jgi:hypothetical protein